MALTNDNNPRRLSVTGIAYSTSDINFKSYFERFGETEHSEIVRDRQGRSKGYGHVSYVNSESVQLVLQMAPHVLDGRTIDLRLDSRDTNTKRIFVARIPPEITDNDFRNYFELFGRVQDAYMPKDHTKQSYRGIGFVTFEDPNIVDQIVRQKHQLGGVHIAVDRAIVNNDNVVPSNTNFYAPNPDHLILNLQNLNLTNQILGLQTPQSILSPQTPLSPHSTLYSPVSPTPLVQDVTAQMQQYANNSINVQDVHNQLQYVISPPGSPIQQNYFNNILEAVQQPPLMGTRSDISGLVSPTSMLGQGQGQGYSQGQGQDLGLEYGGYRIFIGKLTRDTTEQDVREYFQQYGFILDVYLPKNKDNRGEHRGFGFVTFETYTSVQRIANDGDHRIKGTTIVIDVALPRKEEVDVNALLPAQVQGYHNM